MHEPRPIKRAVRIDTNAPGILIDADGAERPVVVADLSAGGCRIITDAMPIIGEHVRLRVGRIADYPAQVRWALGNEAGLEFTGPADPLDD